MLTLEQFAKAVPCSLEIAKRWHPVIVLAAQKWDVSTPQRMAGWIAQMSMECKRFTQFTENLNYSVQGLANTWPSRFAMDPKSKIKYPNTLAWKLGRTDNKPCDQRALANEVYGSRMGNRPGTNDGWDYRGRGPKQITGHDNYFNAGIALGLDLVKNPDLLLVPEHGAQAAGWYWASHGCNQLMDAGDFLAATKAINGGTIGYEDGNTVGLDDRVELWQNARNALGV